MANNTTPCGGGCLDNNPCVEKDCACPVFITSDCVDKVTEDLVCSNIKKGQTLTAVLVQLDKFICEKFNQLASFFVILNVGGGKEIYKGVNGVGQKLLRTLVKVGNLITLNQTADTVEVGLDETVLTTFVQTNQKTYQAGILLTSTIVGNVTTFNVDQANLKTYSANNVGVGMSVYKDNTPLLNNTQFNFKRVSSNTLDVKDSLDGNTLEINMPLSATIPAIYVNDLYPPSYQDFLAGGGKGIGSLAKPFTNTRTYTSPTTFTDAPNTAIQNALDHYVGTQTRLNPQRVNQKIIVQNNNIGYTFTGDFNYSSLDIIIEALVTVNPIVPNTFLVDMDNPANFNIDSSYCNITLRNGGFLDITNSLGFNNSGNSLSVPPLYDTGKILQIKGDGTLYSSYNGSQVLTRYMFNGNGNNNDDGLHFNIECVVRNLYSGIYLCKNKMRIDFYNSLRSGELNVTVNPALQAFRMIGGQVRFYQKAGISLSGGVRIYGITFQPTISDNINFQLNSAQVAGNSNYCFAKLSDGNVNFIAFNSPSGDGFATLDTSGAVNSGLFENLGSTRWGVNFKNNVFSYTGIDHTKVDLTLGNGQSVTNFIGNNVVENLVTRDNRLNAIASGTPLYSVYLKTNGTIYPNTSTWVRDIVLPA